MTRNTANRVVINADDFGLSLGVCRAILDLFERDAISNTTVMLAAPGARDRVARYAKELKGRAGVHLQLTGGRPTLDGSLVPSLYDTSRQGFRALEDVSRCRPEDVEAEWASQLDLAFELGLEPTHIDTHHGVHLLVGFLDVYLRLAERYGLGVRGDEEPVRSRMASYGIKGATRIVRSWTGKGLGLKGLVDALRSEIDRGQNTDEIIEVIAHPGYIDEELRNVSSLVDARSDDFAELCALHEQRWLDKLGLQLVAYPSLS